MNKPFSFRSDMTPLLPTGDALTTGGPFALKIRWEQPVKFALTPRQGGAWKTQSAARGAESFPLPSPRAALRTGLLRWLRSTGLALTILPLAVSAQSLWKDDVSKPMFADKRATGIGDVITILVQESTSTSKDNKTATGKESGLDASLATFLYSPAASGLLTHNGSMPAMKFNSKSDFTGGGSINNSEKLSARAAVQVKDVLPNRNLVIEGRRETSVGGEQQTMILRGIIRPEDVLANNTVYSYNVADASIQILSKGVLTDSGRKGWLHKVWDKVSPF